MLTTITKKIAYVCLVATLVSCGSSNDKNTTLRIGVQAGPEYALAEEAKKVAKEQYDLDVELISFNDYIMPNEALRQKDIDLNIFQNQPYLDTQSESRGYDFAAVGKTFVFPMAGYSKKIKTIDELKEGDTIVIPNDPTNLGRALLLLEQVGLLALKDDVGLLPRLADIVDNKLNLNVLELEAPQLPRTLDDNKVTVAVINNTFAASYDLTAKRDGIFVENEDSPYVNLIVSRQDNKEDERVKKFTKAYQSKEVEAVAESIFKGGAIKGW